jgi:anti-sigma-K factor RskA
MSIHNDIQELIPTYVLDALEPDERARVEAHARACDQCAPVLAEYERVGAALAYSVPPRELPPGLKTRTLLNLKKQTAAPKRERVVMTPRRRFGSTPLFAGAALVLALLAFAWTIWQNAQVSGQLAQQRDLLTVIAYGQGTVKTIRGTQNAPEAVGKLYLDPDSNVAALVTIDMPPINPDQVYVVWLTSADGQRTAVGTFIVDAGGTGWLVVRAPRPLQEYARVWITNEPRSVPSTPTGKTLLAAPLTPQ